MRVHFWPRLTSVDVIIGEMMRPWVSAVGADVQWSSSLAAMPRTWISLWSSGGLLLTCPRPIISLTFFKRSSILLYGCFSG